MKRKWTKASAENYIKTARQKGLTYWSAVDYLKYQINLEKLNTFILPRLAKGGVVTQHKTIYPII